MINTERGWRGGENQVALLVRGLPADRFAVTTACLPEEPLARSLRALGAEVHGLPARGGLDPRAVWRLRRLIRATDAQLVHAHASHAHSLAALALLGRRVPLVVSRRVDFPIAGGRWGAWKYRRAQAIIAVSAEVGRVLAAGGVDRARIRVIHDGVDPGRARADPPGAVRRELGLPPEAVVCLNAAHLTAHKDHATLLAAFRVVEAADARAYLLIAGAGELAQPLVERARELGLTRCRFLGYRHDLAAIMAEADCFVLSSRQEGLGSVIMEAMFAGLPVVATRAGGIPELVDHERDGLLTPVGDPPALAQALLRLITDSEMRTRLSAAARSRAQQHYHFQRMAAAHAQLYDELLGHG